MVTIVFYLVAMLLLRDCYDIWLLISPELLLGCSRGLLGRIVTKVF